MGLSLQLRECLDQAVILPRRIVLETPGVCATVPMVRGVWGAALHGLDAEAYEQVFTGTGPLNVRTPHYVLRPAPPDSDGNPGLEWILIGEAIRFDQVLLRAWDIASGLGLGPSRQRFHIRRCELLGPEGLAKDRATKSPAWPLSQALWLERGAENRTPCLLRFPAPLRLLRAGRLIERPTLPDLLVAAMRRVSAFLSPEDRAVLARLEPQVMGLGRELAASDWRGARLDLTRYSGSQRAELELRGVSGELDLPEGAGEAWPLLAAAQWLHLGKGTALGLGQLVAEPSPSGAE